MINSSEGWYLPSGTVTFLFTDIEGSTKLAQENPERWEALRERHHIILQSAMDTNNGYVFQIIGDAFCVAFHTVSDGINASIDAQRKLQNEDWGEAPIKVRMGLHTGSAELRGTDYRGYLTLAKVQRVMSVAYGGQILLSNSSAEMLHHELPTGITLRDMKEHRLKGLPYTERLWQVVAPDLQQEFPLLGSLSEIPNNLPVQLTTFIGREKEVEQIKKRLKKNRLITLTGSGGIGKTRLSIQVASELLSNFPHGVWLVELAPITDTALVIRTVCAALHVTPQGDIPALNALTEYLKSKKVLLVVDNCEHLIDTCAQLCDSLLHACPDLRILASSREALGIDGENAYRVPSLSLPGPNDGLSTIEESEAVKLFTERAIATLPNFEMAESIAPVVVQICQRLDGIALAIELAASRVKLLKVEQIASRLDDAFRLLTGGSRTALPRQQTLRALIDWSYDLLSEEEQTVLRRLSVFMGGWTLEAAEFVCDNPNILELLTHLVDKSLVAVDLEHGDEPRYYLLETIRQYAREKLNDSGEGETVRQEHSQWFLKLAEKAKPELLGPNQKIWFERLDREKDNSRSALSWLVENNVEAAVQLASGLFWFWHTYCYWSEGREWYDRLLKSGTDAQGQKSLTPATRAQVLYEAGWLAINEMDTNQSRLMSEESLALYRKLEDKAGMAMVLNTLGCTAYYLNEYSYARMLAEESLTLLQEVALKSKFESVLNLLGHLARVQGSYDQAMEFYKESLKWSRETGNKAAIAYTLSVCGYSAWFQGDLEQAKTLSEEALQLSREIRLEWNAAETLTTLGDIARAKGEYQDASKFYGESNDIWERLGNQRERGYLIWSRGWLARLQGDHEQATDFFNEALNLWREVGDQRHIAECLEGLAGVNAGKTELAAQLMGNAAMIREKTNSPLPPVDRANYDRDVENIRSQLGESNFQKAWAEGRELTMEQVIDLALQRRLR
jgi:predicted ATPase/class 3 adenylate cyclase